MKTKFTVAMVPLSAKPWHSGHTALVKAACRAFDKVVIAVMQNPDKSKTTGKVPTALLKSCDGKAVVVRYPGMLADVVREVNPDAIVRGIRNFIDFEYEKAQQYWNEDLGVGIPFFYVIAPRELVHVSSSAIRTIDKLTKDKKKEPKESK